MELAPQDWLKINSDAAFKRGKTGLTFVVRDEDRNIVQITSRNENCDNAHEAEVLALLWATEVAKYKGWQNVEWSMDAVVVVKEVVSKEVTEKWHTRHAILQIRSRFDLHNWKILWNPRSSNVLANSFAKFALEKINAFNFVNVVPSCLRCFSSLICADLFEGRNL